jgi:hypothetical protein
VEPAEPPSRSPRPSRLAALAPCLGIVAAVALAVWQAPVSAQYRLADESDRQAFKSWFVYLADARFYVPAPDVTDCAALVRHAWREALRAHTPEWRRQSGLPTVPAFPDVRRPPKASGEHWPLFRVSEDAGAPFREFADARTLVRFNARRVAREWQAARPGDLLYYHQAGQREPDHLMVVVGPSSFDASAQDFVVYHTGPDDRSPGEVRKVRMSDLLRHPAPRWRPIPDNRAFIGVFRPAPL